MSLEAWCNTDSAAVRGAFPDTITQPKGAKTMEIRYSCNQRDFKRYTTEETRKEFLIENLYAANEVVAVYSHVDRMVTLGKVANPYRGAQAELSAVGRLLPH